MPIKFSKLSWTWGRAKLVGSSCVFDRCCSEPSIMLIAMLELCSWFRRWITSKAQRLLSASISRLLSLPLNSSDAIQSSPPPVSGTRQQSIPDYTHIHRHVNTQLSELLHVDQTDPHLKHKVITVQADYCEPSLYYWLTFSGSVKK